MTPYTLGFRKGSFTRLSLMKVDPPFPKVIFLHLSCFEFRGVGILSSKRYSMSSVLEEEDKTNKHHNKTDKEREATQQEEEIPFGFHQPTCTARENYYTLSEAEKSTHRYIVGEDEREDAASNTNKHTPTSL